MYFNQPYSSMKGPGKNYREGLTLLQIADMFKDETAAKEWLAEQRWQGTPRCPYCGTTNVQCNVKHPRMDYRCRECDKRPMFSVKTGTVMEASKISYRNWAIGIYLFLTNIKGISSMRLHRELGIGQKAAWFMLHRLRAAFELNPNEPFAGPVEVDETYIGGKRRNMSHSKREELKDTGRGSVGKVAVVGIKDRETNKVKAKAVQDTKAITLQSFVINSTQEDAQVYTDDSNSYIGLKRKHDTVNHSVQEYVKGLAHTNGIESFWAMIKRAHKGTYHKFSKKHLNRYVIEFAGRHNIRELDTVDQMNSVVSDMAGKRLKYKQLIADNGLDSGARETTDTSSRT